MKTKYFKRLLINSLFFILLFSLLMIMPRTLGYFFPEKPPVGYHFEPLNYLAVGVGLEKLADLEPEVPETIEEIKNVEYKNVNGKSLQIDFYKPMDVDEPLPLLLFIHGGGWKTGKRSDYMVYSVSFAKKGYMTATVSYRLKHDSIYPANVEDVSDAVEWVFKNGENFGYDPHRVALIGGSAGAHLSMLTAYGWRNSFSQMNSSTKPYQIKAVVNIYGPVDLTDDYAQTQPLVTGFMGHSYNQKPELYKEASPVTYLNKSIPPTMILHGTSDKLVPVSQADTLKNRLDELGVPCEYYKLPFWPHSMDVAKRVNDFSQKKMELFFEEYLLR